MRRSSALGFAFLVVASCDEGEAMVKTDCTSAEECPEGFECVETRCVDPSNWPVGGGTGGGGGSLSSCPGSGVEACNGIDDDCDGVTDPPSCPWYFGDPMPVVELHSGLGDHLHPYVSPDGLRIYYGAFDPSGAATTVVASRASRHERFLAPSAPGEPFRAPTVVAGLAPLGAAGTATFSSDELEGFIQIREPGSVHFDIAWRTRSDPNGVFTDRGFVPGASRGGVDEIQPFVSRDGHELFFSANPLPSVQYRLFRIERDQNGEFSGDATELTLLGDQPAVADWSPFLADDGETLFYESIRRPGEGPVLMRAVRDRYDRNVFTIAGVLPGRNTNAAITGEPFLVERTGELFFVSSRDGSPASIGIYRMRVCRDQPCPEETPAPCPRSALAAVRSADGRHCYAALEAAGGLDAARAACGAVGATLASLHSELEAALVLRELDGGRIGARDLGGNQFAWDTGEPFLYARWAEGSPTAENGCVSLARAVDVNGLEVPVFVEGDCARNLGAICEVERYPTW